MSVSCPFILASSRISSSLMHPALIYLSAHPLTIRLSHIHSSVLYKSRTSPLRIPFPYCVHHLSASYAFHIRPITYEFISHLPRICSASTHSSCIHPSSHHISVHPFFLYSSFQPASIHFPIHSVPIFCSVRIHSAYIHYPRPIHSFHSQSASILLAYIPHLPLSIRRCPIHPSIHLANSHPTTP